MSVDMAQSIFMHFPQEGELPYRPHSRAHITLLVHLALNIQDDGEPVDWHAVPALGERMCREFAPPSIIKMIDFITTEINPPFVSAKRAFRLPLSLFAEVPILLAIHNSHAETYENVLVHFQGARMFLRHISDFEEKDHTRDDCEIAEVIVVGASLIAAGTLSETHPQDEVYLSADSNRVIWTPFWERFSDSHAYTRILEIARWNARVYDMLAIEAGDNPINVPNSWRLWLSVHVDLSPPRWLMEHQLRATIPHDLESGRYAYRLTSFTCPFHGDFVVWQYY